MIYNKEDLVYYKKYLGKIRFAIVDNKTYMVTLYNYRGFKQLDMQIDQCLLEPAYEQIEIAEG